MNENKMIYDFLQDYINRDITKYVLPLYLKDENDLLLSTERGDLDYIKYLVEIGIDLGYKDKEIFKIATEKGQLKIIEYLLEFGYNLTENDFNEGLYYACKGGYLELSHLMIEKGAKDFNRGLYRACLRGHLEIAKLMLAIDFDRGLYWACVGRHLDLIKFLSIEKEKMKLV